MPVIEVKTNTTISKEQKTQICNGFMESFKKAGEEEVSHNILFQVEGDKYINFRENDEEPSALVIVHPGYMTAKEDYKKLVEGFFGTMKEVFPEMDPYRIYITIAQIDHWGWNGDYLG